MGTLKVSIKIIKMKKYFLLGFLWIFIFYILYFIKGKDAYYPISDNIELISYYKILQNTNSVFAKNDIVIENELLGVPRICFPSELYFITWLSFLFKLNFDILELWMFLVINISLISYISMHRFLTYILNKLNYEDSSSVSLIKTITSLFFACSPQWALSGFSVALQPAIVLSLLKIINNEDRLKNWLLIATFPIFSSFIYSNIFFFIFILLLYVLCCIILRKIKVNGLLAILLLIFITLIVEYRLFSFIINPPFEHNRISANFNSRTNISIIDFVKETILIIKQELLKNPLYFLWGYYDPIIRIDNFVIVLSYLVITPFLRDFKNNKLHKYIYFSFILFVLLMMASIGNPLFLKILFSKILPLWEKTFYSLSVRYISNISQYIFCLMLFHILIMIRNYFPAKTLILVLSIILLLNIYQPSHNELNNPIMSNLVFKLKPTYAEYIDHEKFKKLKMFLKDSLNIPYDKIKFLVFSDYENYKIFNHQLFLLHDFQTIGGYLPLYPQKNMLKLNVLKDKINNFSKSVNYNHFQTPDTRYMSYFLPKIKDSLMIDDNVLSYINSLGENILISSNLPISVFYPSNYDLTLIKILNGKKYNVFLYEITNKKEMKTLF